MQRGLINLAIGVVAVIIGLGVSIGSYVAVSKSGGTYFVAWGAVAIGAWRALLGLFQILRGAATGEGRASIGRLIWPRSSIGRIARLGVVLVIAAIVWYVAPDRWKTLSPASLLAFQAGDEAELIAYSPDAKLIAVGMGYGGLALVDANTAEKRAAPALGAYTDVEFIGFSPDGRSLAAATSSGLKILSGPDWGCGGLSVDPQTKAAGAIPSLFTRWFEHRDRLGVGRRLCVRRKDRRLDLEI